MAVTVNRVALRIILLVTVLIGWGLALARLGERSFWADEGFTAVLARDAPSVGVLKMLRLDPNQGVLHLLLMIGVIHVGGQEFVVRFPSAMATTLVLPLVYVLGRRLMSEGAGLAGTLLHSVSPYVIGYAQEARPYALLELLCCLSLVLLLKALTENRWSWWAGLGGTFGSLLYTHHFAWFVLGAEALFSLLVLLRSSLAQRRLDPRCVRFAACLLLGLTLYLPWLPVLLAFWRQAGPGGSPIQTAGLPRFELSLQFFRDMISVFGPRAYGWRLYLYAAALLLGVVAVVARRRWQALVLIGLWFAVPLAVLTAFAAAHFFDFRYVIFFLPVLLLLVAEGLAAGSRLACRLVPGANVARSAPLLATGFALMLFVPANYSGLRAHYLWEKENWRGISSFVSDNLDSGDAIYVSPRYWANPMLYYQPSLRKWLVGGSAEDVSQLVAAAEAQPGLWFLRYSGKLGDPTGQFQTWLDQRGFVQLVDGHGCGSGIHVYYGRTGDGAMTRMAELLAKASRLCSTDTRKRRTP